jgi:hypothetical protein
VRGSFLIEGTLLLNMMSRSIHVLYVEEDR